MTNWMTAIKEWLPAMTAVAAMIIASCYAVSRTALAAEGIHEVNDLAATLSETAKRAQTSTRSQDEIKELKARKEHLECRMADVMKPSLVQAELMQSASKVDLEIREAQLLADRGQVKQKEGSVRYPRYRILVSGTYRQIAEFMHLCSEQRLPARVTEFRLRRSEAAGPEEELKLTADITVEAFQPAQRVDETQ